MKRNYPAIGSALMSVLSLIAFVLAVGFQDPIIALGSITCGLASIHLAILSFRVDP